MDRPAVLLLAAVVGVAFTVSRCDCTRRWGPPPHHRHGPPRRETRGPVDPGFLPAWPTNDPRWLGAGGGARVTVEVTNDCPTLTGARATFSARLRVPRELEAAWGDAEPLDDAHPDCGSGRHPGPHRGGRGHLLSGDPGRKGPRFVYVWSGLGRSWQVAGNATSWLVLETRGVPLGSHHVSLVVYRRGGSRQFVPVARASSQFTVTDQVPFSVELSQSAVAAAGSGQEKEEAVGGEDARSSGPLLRRQRFVAGPNVLFEARLHDPSGFLRGADVSFSWDFGDGSGLLISRLAHALHSYAGPGAYAARLAVQATVPAPCATTAAAVGAATSTMTAAASAATAAAVTTTTAATSNTTTTATDATVGGSTTESASTAAPEEPSAITSRAVAEPYGTTATWDLTPSTPSGTSGVLDRAAAASRESPELSLLLLLSQELSGQDRPTDCPLYRYGTYSTTVEVVDGIATAQVRRAVSVTQGGALFSAPHALLDFEVESHGGSPTQVCSELLSEDCADSLEGEAACEPVAPGTCAAEARVCSLVLRREFHSAGSYCLRVTVADALSRASATTRLSLQSISEPASLEAAVIIGALAVALVIGIAVLMHRRGALTVDAATAWSRPREEEEEAGAVRGGGGVVSGSRWLRRWWPRGLGVSVRDLLATRSDTKHALLVNA
ncbi:melanocyte protein PMEL isoform X2 [Lethenteron reissneri]|uniref:melanocyte protein PMEL isoform X2 n=1 Tax=Lethenteron reissneri TaxID=7753 RepID=UPI002AB6913F|nr:melanocyte protein PMEL isoform X2 [Lethenteron reissneri]